MGLLIGGIFWLACMIAAEVIASAKRRSGCGFSLLTLFLGPIGLLAAVVVTADERVLVERDLRAGRLVRCLWCAEPIHPQAVICRSCGRDNPQPEDTRSAAGKFLDWILRI